MKNRSPLSTGVTPINRKGWAFTLVELLVVIVIVAVMMVFVVPSTIGVLSGFTLTQHGQDLMDKLSLCRQWAMTNNRETELRIIKNGTGETATYAYQIWSYDEKGANPKPMGRIARIPDNILFNDTLSPMMALLTTGRADFPALGKDLEYKALRYRVNGTALGSFNINNYLTLNYNRGDQAAPKNFYTIQINPMTGLVSVFRP